MTELLYTPGSGLLYRLDPRSKLLSAVGVVVYLTLESHTGTLLLALLLLHILCVTSQATRARLLPLWRTLAPLLLLVVLLGSLGWRAEPAILRAGSLTVTRQAIWAALGMATRIVSLSLTLSLVLWTTEPGDAVAGLTQLGVPFAIGFSIIVALQYLVTFQRRFRDILEAQQSRGLTFSHRNPIQVGQAYVPVLVPLIISALRSADNLALALESRGFSAKRPRTSRRQLRFGFHDWASVLAVLGTLTILGLL